MTDKKKYFVNFIEEGIFNPEYYGCIGGRVEISSDGPYADNEIRFFFRSYDYPSENSKCCDTSKMKKWNEFRESWDFKEYSNEEIKKLEDILKKEWYEADITKLKR